MSHFYLTLPSDSSSKYYPENTTASFKTKLSDRIDLDGEYEVGMTQLIYPHSWYNFNNSDKNMYISFKPDEEDEIVHVFRSGQFPDEKTFVHVLNDLISSADIYGCVFSWDKWDRRIRVLISNRNGSIYLSRAFADLMGFEDVGPYKTRMSEEGMIAQYYEAQHTFDLNVGLRMIYVYSDIVSHTLVGDTKVPLLRVCTTEGTYGEMVSTTFTDPHYVPLARNGFDTIELNINNELGKPAAFEYGKSVVTLHFRRKNRLI